MASSRTTKRAIGIALAVASLALAASVFLRGEYATTQTASRTFTIDEDFTSVRKILVRTDAAKQIVTMGGNSEFVSQHWRAVGGEIDAQRLLDADWRLELYGTLRVRTTDEYIGEQVITLQQHVVITPDSLVSKVHLQEPSDRLKKYEMTTRFARDPQGAQTQVELELTQEILTNAPWFAHGIADRRVRAAAERTLENQETAIRKIIADNIDDVPIFPLR